MNNKLSKKQIVVIASTLFGMIFGAGNLIFPVHLGQLSGSNALLATIGFVITAVGLPILGIIAIGITESKGLFSFTTKVSKGFAYAFTTILYLTIGPLFVMPRSANISFESGLNTIIGDKFDHNLSLLIFSLIFFLIVAFFSLRPSGITTWIGKIINPIFLLLLFILLLVCFINPMGSISEATPSAGYDSQPLLNGFLEGYGTMDVLSGLAFGIIVINIVKSMGIKDKNAITKNIALPSILSGALMIVIYAVTIIMGVQSLGVFELSSNGSIALNQISNHYFGLYGNAILTAIVTLASIKTSIGLVTSCSATFSKMFPKFLNYNKWTVIFIFISFAIANIGLDLILEISVPVLKFLYPISVILIILAYTGRWFDHNKIVYRTAIIFTLLPAVLDFIAFLPQSFVDMFGIQDFVDLCSTCFPFAEVGFGWFVPSIMGIVFGIILWKIRCKQLEYKSYSE